ncbi:imidazole glycerol phosphate synthase subunit HisF [Lacticaseibacillus casei]|uniref:Imidazole glycerol phosphate synthase subunit HisF n=1 Tax=Lacticaseibacillus huelsenbergensis TaxID=3035291 RepID=A0ABY8DPM3_9LACO|nr:MULTISPECIES: imidazole glycerol phosphate synthase subunit HisF [Lacticaseibacillus]MDG3061742.1 imidazole glycerol phosphate synthase subunit HisF [Lacticaseibacillus sp. BCRC 81376]QVI37805.1 imidazole glycerol phosphate synthase subunit HisF [Lacticaseibacillus casei]QXG59596.1 imidazole glycerol phosphate synthase subunit HisF [Lacticaseibacillus casei]WFB38940.1 imidazole glycerol phosphate synthase subunit HisF [Lacticaseibacillus huelsenbergensis]WFB43334.1 imidazole glycerol phosph
MLTKRIISCLDVDQGRVKKGVHFIQLKDVGDPVAIAKAYEAQGADELVFLDITATTDARQTMTQTVAAVAAQVFMPLTVGGGIRSVADMHDLLRAGADKIALNSAAVKQPKLITAGAETFGSQAVVVAIDTRWQAERQRYQVTINGGRTPVDLDAIQWAKQAVAAGAGELLVTSMDADGTQEGFDLALYRQLSAAVTVPIVASGGAGSAEDFVALFKETAVSAGLAASIFHFGQLTIPEVKTVLKQAKVAVR